MHKPRMPMYSILILDLHIDPDAKQGDCVWYARGFCKHGKDCRHKHIRLAVCQMYICGFCPRGENCAFGHPKYELPPGYDVQPNLEPRAEPQAVQPDHAFRKLSDITCFKCGEQVITINSGTLCQPLSEKTKA
jgi:cleavage and polyadenylation specificity factor subunit 4